MKNLKSLGYKILTKSELKSISGSICKGGKRCTPGGANPGCSGGCYHHGSGRCGGWRCTPRIIGIN